jgi:hypothetical protein
MLDKKPASIICKELFNSTIRKQRVSFKRGDGKIFEWTLHQEDIRLADTSC